MLPKQVKMQCTVACKCCGASAALYDVCDFAKNCEERRGKKLPLTGIPIYYYRCESCGFVFTDQFDDASIAELGEMIYNEAYVGVDPDYLSVRPTSQATWISRTFDKSKRDLRVLDYGGGTGVLADHLRKNGFTHVETYDPFNPRFAARPEGKFDLIVSFEVVEHVADPVDLFANLASFLKGRAGLIVFSTLLVPDDIDTMRAGWWYIAPRNGHISLHTAKSLKQVLKRFGLSLGSASQGLHFALSAIPEFAAHLLRAT